MCPRCENRMTVLRGRGRKIFFCPNCEIGCEVLANALAIWNTALSPGEVRRLYLQERLGLWYDGVDDHA